MTLQCECGGVLEITSQSYNGNHAFEAYECASCGRTGSMNQDMSGTSLRGCVVRR